MINASHCAVQWNAATCSSPSADNFLSPERSLRLSGTRFLAQSHFKSQPLCCAWPPGVAPWPLLILPHVAALHFSASLPAACVGHGAYFRRLTSIIMYVSLPLKHIFAPERGYAYVISVIFDRAKWVASTCWVSFSQRSIQLSHTQSPREAGVIVQTLYVP